MTLRGPFAGGPEADPGAVGAYPLVASRALFALSSTARTPIRRCGSSSRGSDDPIDCMAGWYTDLKLGSLLPLFISFLYIYTTQLPLVSASTLASVCAWLQSLHLATSLPTVVGSSLPALFNPRCSTAAIRAAAAASIEVTLSQNTSRRARRSGESLHQGDSRRSGLGTSTHQAADWGPEACCGLRLADEDRRLLHLGPRLVVGGGDGERKPRVRPRVPTDRTPTERLRWK